MKTTYLTFAPHITDRSPQGLPTKFSGVAYSGGLIPNYSWYGDTVIDLTSFSIPETPIFALLDHDQTKRVGKLSARIDNHQILVDGDFFVSTEEGRTVAALFQEGAPWQLSIGIQSSIRELLKPINVNGQIFSCRTVLENGHLHEVSFVPMGADPNTTVKAFSQNHKDDATMNIEELQTRITELTAENEKLAATLAATNERASVAENTIATLKAAARETEIKQLAATVHFNFSKPELETFAAMPDDMFAAVSKTLLSVARPPDKSFYTEQATAGKTTNAVNLTELNAKLMQQYSGH